MSSTLAASSSDSPSSATSRKAWRGIGAIWARWRSTGWLCAGCADLAVERDRIPDFGEQPIERDAGRGAGFQQRSGPGPAPPASPPHRRRRRPGCRRAPARSGEDREDAEQLLEMSTKIPPEPMQSPAPRGATPRYPLNLSPSQRAALEKSSTFRGTILPGRGFAETADGEPAPGGDNQGHGIWDRNDERAKARGATETDGSRGAHETRSRMPSRPSSAAKCRRGSASSCAPCTTKW